MCGGASVMSRCVDDSVEFRMTVCGCAVVWGGVMVYDRGGEGDVRVVHGYRVRMWRWGYGSGM